MSDFNIYSAVTQRIIEQLEEGTVPWRKPWTGTRNGAYSRVMKRPYSLLNQLLLDKPGEWLTYKEIIKLGGFVNKGEKSKIVVFWKPIVIQDEDEEKERTIPILRYYRVFHIDQTTGIKPLDLAEELAILTPCEDAEAVINNYIAGSGVSLHTKVSNRAFYEHSSDTITVPIMEQYTDTGDYYSTVFHEIVHSTGHKDRLNRLVKGAFLNDKEKYAKEELVAEIGSAALCNTCGIETPNAFDNSVAYIQSWLKELKKDDHLIVQASGQAQKAVNFVLSYMPENRS